MLYMIVCLRVLSSAEYIADSMWHDLLFIDRTSLYPCRTHKKGISNAQLLMVASSSSIARERNDSDAKYLSDSSGLVWCSYEIPGDINMPAAYYRYFSDDRVRDSTVLSENSRQISVGLRAIIIPVLAWERYYIHSSSWMKRAAPFRKGWKKESYFFSRKLSPREKQLFPACESRPPNVPAKYRLDIDRVSSSKRQRFRPTKRPICLSETLEFSREVFPPSSRVHRRRRSRLTCCRKPDRPSPSVRSRAT